MADEMGSWRSLASSASRSIRGYVAQRDWKRTPSADPRVIQPTDESQRPSSLRQWAGQTLRAISQPSTANTYVEKLALFPGWAHRKYHEQLIDIGASDSAPFDVELLVSGYASQVSNAGFETRSGRTLLYAAKMFAALPKIAAEEAVNAVTGNRPVEPAEDDLMASMHLPPKPEDMTDEAETQALAEQMREMSVETASISTNESTSSSVKSDVSSIRSSSDVQTQTLHKNLETRFLPFVSSSLSGRPIRILIYATNPEELNYKSPPLGSYAPDEDYAAQRSPLSATEIVTGADGSFQAKIRVPWEKMCTHPAALHVAFGCPDTEHTFYVAADLMNLPPLPPSPGTQQSYAVRTPRVPRNLPPVTTAYLKVPLTNATVRLISDIDDTVKMSGILSGTKAAFYNVFVKDLSEGIIPGMGEWYSEMWKRGVRFHYVSNSPFELLPVVNEFLSLSRLPPGSVKLRSYTGRRILSELFKAPAERKRANIMDVIESFPHSRFFLVGDSGEQDMELYATIAKERPQQILAILIRDASDWDVVKPLDDPTGSQARNVKPSLTPLRRLSPTNTPESIASGDDSSSTTHSGDDSQRNTATYTVRQARKPRSLNLPQNSGANGVSVSDPDYFVSTPVSASPITELPPISYPPPAFSRLSTIQRQNSDASTISNLSMRPPAVRRTSNGSIRGVPPMTAAERKQFDLQMRVYRARSTIPDHIPLRVFRDPGECIETGEILEQMGMGTSQC